MKASQLRLKICRAKEFPATLVKKGPLGVTFGMYKKALIIKAINAGPVLEWNKAHTVQIKSGDQIIEANGVKGSASDLLDTLKVDGVLKIVVLALGGAGYAE